MLMIAADAVVALSRQRSPSVGGVAESGQPGRTTRRASRPQMPGHSDHPRHSARADQPGLGPAERAEPRVAARGPAAERSGLKLAQPEWLRTWQVGTLDWCTTMSPGR